MASILKIVTHGGPSTIALSDYIGKHGDFLLDPESGQILFLDGSTPGGVPIGSGGASLSGFTSVLLTGPPPNDTINTSILASVGGTTDQDVVILPRGAGGFALSVPDGMSTGGNKRGQYAVDLQIFSSGKNSPTQIASGPNSFASGNSNTASNDKSVVFGWGNTSSGNASFAEGAFNLASNFTSHAEGSNTISSGSASHAEGNNTTASNSYTHAEGDTTSATAVASHAEGSNTTSSGYASHSEGTGTQATNDNTHAEGINSQATGIASHAEGNGTIASGDYAHVEGQNSVAAGHYSHAEGNNTLANGTGSQATGEASTARGVDFYQAYSSGVFIAVGDQQSGRIGLRQLTTDATPTVITSNGELPTSSNQMNVISNMSAIFKGTVIARDISSNDTACFTFAAMLKNVGGTVAVVGEPVVTQDFADSGATAWTITIDADDSAKALSVIATGADASSIHWSAEVRSQELVIIGP